MDSDTVDRHELDWAKIKDAAAFEMPNGDEYLIQRKVDCPGCGHVYAMVLVTGAVVHYGKRHTGCEITMTTELDEEENESNG